MPDILQGTYYSQLAPTIPSWEVPELISLHKIRVITVSTALLKYHIEQSYIYMKFMALIGKRDLAIDAQS